MGALGTLMQRPPYPDFYRHLLRTVHYPASWPEGLPWQIGSALALLAGFWGLGLLAGWLIRRAAERADRRVAAAGRPEGTGAGPVLGLLRRPVRLILTLVGAHYALHAIGLRGRAEGFLDGVVFIAAVLVATRTVVLLVGRGLSWYAGRLPDAARLRAERDYVPLGRKLAWLFIVLCALVVSLNHFGQSIGAVVAALGVGSLAIGLAAKDILGNMLAGFVLLVDRPFGIGDRVKLATGEEGDVMEIGIRSTRIRLVDLHLLVVPNSELVNTRVTNMMLPTPVARAIFDVHLGAGADPAKAKDLLLAIVRELPDWVPEPAPTAHLTDIIDGRLKITTTFFVREYAQVALMQEQARTLAHARLTAAGLDIAAPRLDLRQAGGRGNA
ncbi:MAG TPA: mechanosensitive ion channel family protein [Polyangia bacterium]|jgi:small-conductance mechanosensitive channel